MNKFTSVDKNMETNNRNFKNQIEINDLIDAAVSDALARRSGNDDNLSDLSGEDADHVTGGIASLTIAGYKPIPICPPIIKPICPPIIVGLIAPPQYEIM
ncbi:hypothetical protein [Nostoc sp. CMAA1605]|uniref:hypothetical protein n=1 Tax=Nostoc sp. CMAA1605 TaxID=2055159 RepID=UPI001F3DA75B|nr:hypothetical protein [Nostoc sp. CMAA1605]